MNKIIEIFMKIYLKKNWKHIAASLVVIVLQILLGSGTITQEQDAMASGILISLGLITTKNSGTADAINSAKNS